MMRTRRVSLFCLVALAAAVATTAFASPAARQKQSQTTAQNRYQHAQELEATLEKQPGGKRTETGYLKVIAAYRSVQQAAQTPLLVTPSLVAIGRLYDEMGHLFDTGYFQKAVDAYRYFLRMYPHSHLAPQALYAVAELERGPLQNPTAARKSLESLVKLYPSSDQADRARLEIAGKGETRDSASQRPSTNQSASARSETVSAPAASLKLKMGPVEGGEEGSGPTRVSSVATEGERDATRVVVYLSGPVKFHAARIAHPERVYFDLTRAYLVHAHGTLLNVHSPYVDSVRVAQNRPRVVRVVLNVGAGDGYSASLLRNPYRLVIDVGKQPSGSRAAASSQQKSSGQAKANAGTGGQTAQKRTASTKSETAPRTKGNLTPARPTQSGATSMTRALGLKIDRIVIDPGHGGFDTGSIGPTGLEEKTVALEIARRLGNLISQRLPGTQVVYTRDSDKFIPLEERTEIANKDKADLFISIHANSSTDRKARGVEVYYLNFNTSPEAVAVAARENALAQVPAHQLQTLLKEISLNDKIEESQELAVDVDHSLVHELLLGHVRAKDRGIKKAPFVVLIGAHMPSILVEVSFLSNPTDERLLKEARYRQRVALGLFDGIQRYVTSLNSLSVKEAKSSLTAQQ